MCPNDNMEANRPLLKELVRALKGIRSELSEINEKIETLVRKG